MNVHLIFADVPMKGEACSRFTTRPVHPEKWKTTIIPCLTQNENVNSPKEVPQRMRKLQVKVRQAWGTAAYTLQLEMQLLHPKPAVYASTHCNLTRAKYVVSVGIWLTTLFLMRTEKPWKNNYMRTYQKRMKLGFLGILQLSLASSPDMLGRCFHYRNLMKYNFQTITSILRRTRSTFCLSERRNILIIYSSWCVLF